MNVRNILIAALSLSGIGFVYKSFSGINPDPAALSIILTGCSAALSWITADYFSSQQNNLRIDGVGERSSEKILNQSKQLWEIEQFIQAKSSELSDDKGVQHLLAAKEMIALVRSSNNTYVGDWEGIVSNEIQQKMRGRNEEQNELFRSAASGEELPESSKTEGKLPTHLTPVFNQAISQNRRTILLNQDVATKTTKESKGILRAQLLQDSPKFNFTGKLYPHFDNVPSVLKARVKVSPSSAPDHIYVNVSTGTTHDFHVHARSSDTDMLLPAGEYTFEYLVKDEEIVDSIEANCTGECNEKMDENA